MKLPLPDVLVELLLLYACYKQKILRQTNNEKKFETSQETEFSTSNHIKLSDINKKSQTNPHLDYSVFHLGLYHATSHPFHLPGKFNQ